MVQRKNRKRERQQIQSSTPIGWDNKLRAPKEGQLYEKTSKALIQHHLQSQIKNAPSEKQIQEQPNPDMQSVWQPTETQQHVLEECEVIHLVGEYKVYNNEIFSNNTNNLKSTATNIRYVLDQLYNQPVPKEGTTTTTTCTIRQPCTARPTRATLPPGDVHSDDDNDDDDQNEHQTVCFQ